MTMTAPERSVDLEVDPQLETIAPDAAAEGEAAAPEGPTKIDASRTEEAPVSVLLTCAAAFLASAAAGWMCAGVFRGGLPRIVGLLGPAIGAGTILLSYRTKRPSTVQYLAIPIAVVVGALLVLPDAGGGTANLPGLVIEAIRAGGISQPPVAFEPGWRFLLILLTAIIGAGAASLGLGLNKPKIAIALPIPLVFGAALVQPKGATMVSTLVALVLGIGAMAVAFGVDLAKEGATSGQFEARRLGRSAGVLAGLVVALVALSQLGFLFPDTEDDQIIPPKRPEMPPPSPDRVLFTVRADRQVPFRLGTLDVYQDNAWMLPPFDSGRLTPVVQPAGTIPYAGKPEKAQQSTIPKPPSAPAERRIKAAFTVEDVQGGVIPTMATPLKLTTDDFKVEFDPRTQSFRLPDGRPRQGTTYNVEALIPPTAQELAAAPDPAKSVAEFLQVPEAPPEVETLLAEADAEAKNRFERLQFVRNKFYSTVVAAGAGNPVDVPPDRVVDMLNGIEASPYEITAAEVLLARWAGVPARIGYGYFGGDKPKDPPADGTVQLSVRPKHGATWLEAYFEGYGFVPIIGTPPKAKASIKPDDKKDDPTIRPTDELAIQVYVPYKQASLQLLYVVVRYWVVRALPYLAVALLVGGFYPGVVKMARRWKRRRWAARFGYPERIAVAYAEFRDAINDYNIGDPMHTPLEFVADLEPDPEHLELAWLITRTVWGDMRRDLRIEDVEAAEEMASSLTKRFRRANNGLPRVIAFGARASLRDPYSTEIPNLWFKPNRRRPLRALRRRIVDLLPGKKRRRIRARRPASATAIIAIVLAMFTGGCVQRADLTAKGASGLPEQLVPDTFEKYRFVREETAEKEYAKVDDALVTDGRVFSIHEEDVIQGSFQIAGFKPGLLPRSEDVREGVLRSLGGGRFQPVKIAGEVVYIQRLPEQRMFLWFPPNNRYYNLMVSRQTFSDADRLFASILAFQRGDRIGEIDGSKLQPLDPRRGGRES